MYYVVLMVLVVFSSRVNECARILGVAPTPSYSHQIVFRPIWNELARRGHDVVVITTDPQNDPNLNITEIDISPAYDIWFGNGVMKNMNENKNIFALTQMIVEVCIDICKLELSHPGVQSLLRNESEHFDLVIVEYMFPMMFGFADRFKAPYIGVVPMDLLEPFHSMFGNPVHPIAYPNALTTLVGKLNFWERLGSTIFHLVMSIMDINEGFQKSSAVRKMMEEHFGSDVPPLEDIVKNVSMVLINESPVFNIRPLGRAFVLFGGGAHLTPLKPLPQDLKEYLDSAKDGFIYFSMGTNVKSDIFLPEKRKIVLDAFRELPYKVLWKFDVTDIPDVPDNVKIATWLPQQDILRHPNIKVFITQGGLQSTEEAIFSHVPVVAIPYMGDQYINVKRLVEKGGGISLDKDSLTKDSVKEAVLEVINNPKYKNSIIELAELLRDEPMTGIEKAVWWAEYVIRHKGARHFRNPTMDLPLYQYYLLDVIGFLLAVTSVLLFIVYKLIVFIKNFVVRKFTTSSGKLKAQ